MSLGIRWRWREEHLAESPASYPARIGELAAILDGIPWILGGGLAIPFTTGEFHREHTDIDLLFEDRHFPAIEARFAQHGYALWQHYSMSLFGAFGGAWHIRVRSDGLLPRLRRRKLKFRDETGTRVKPNLMAAVDALPYCIVGNEICTCDNRHRYPITRPLVGYRAKSAAGHEIPCLAFEYVALLKGGRREPKDLHDYAIIRDHGQLPAGDWGF